MIVPQKGGRVVVPQKGEKAASTWNGGIDETADENYLLIRKYVLRTPNSRKCQEQAGADIYKTKYLHV